MTDTPSDATASMPDDSPRPRRRIRLWHIAAIVLLAIVAIPLGSRVYWQTQLRRRIKALAAAGYPTTVEQMDAWYPPLEPDRENLAELIVAVASHIDLGLSEEERELVPLIGQGQLPAPGEPLSTEMREVLNRLIDDHREALDYLYDKPLAPDCRYRLDWIEGFESGFTGLSKARQCASLLSLAAVKAFDLGDAERAIEFLVRAQTIGRSIGEVPLLWVRRSSGRCRNRVLKVLEWGLSHHSLTDAQLAQLAEAFGQDDCQEGLVRALAGMRCLVLPHLEHPKETGDNDSPSAALLDFYRAFGLAARETLIYAETIEAGIQVAQLPLSQWQSATKAIDDRVRSQVGWCLQLNYVRDEGVDILFDFVRSLASRARLDTARTALAVERYRLVRGRLPETLAGLVPEYLESVPLDPFDGAALRYQPLIKGFVVYSVGRNGWDDGGRPPKPGREWERGNWDITFTIER